MLEWIAALPPDLAWPLVCVLAFALAEWLFRVARIPRISTYALIGFVLGGAQLGLLPERPTKAMVLLANIAFGLLLFECGYRINWQWFRRNPWLLLISFLESSATLIGVYLVASAAGLGQAQALILGTLAIPTSPATILRVIHETRASGQVVERLIHFSALNCIYAVLAFKTIVGYQVFQSSGSLFDALSISIWVVATSALVGLVFGVLVPAMLRWLRRTPNDSDLALVLGLVLAVAIVESLELSSIVVSLVYGVVARARGVVLGSRHRDFGVLGELLALFLFVFAAASVTVDAVVAGLALAIPIMIVRLLATTAVTTSLAGLSGTTYRKGALVGLAMAPISAFVILLLEQTPQLGPKLVNQIPALAALVLIMELLGPVLTRLSLHWAGETEERSR
ncbi:MAG: cation:proton antiporter [Ahniella sp.]|nr:cation:proton antiporter [Ahniella sp.]